MTEIDLGKYAAGKRLRALDTGNYLVAGQVYESGGDVYQQHQYQTVSVDGRRFCVDLFVPVEDEAPVAGLVWTKAARAEIDRFYRNARSGQWLDTEPALSPGHAIREPVRLNEAQREAVGKPIPKPWAIPTGEATCAVCAADCSVRDSSDLFTTDDGKDYPLCADCWTTGDASDEWEQSTNDAILRKVPMSDATVSVLMAKRDAKVKRLTVDLDDGSRMKAFPKEGRSDRVTGYRRWEL